jgi:hypothetical protein
MSAYRKNCAMIAQLHGTLLRFSEAIEDVLAQADLDTLKGDRATGAPPVTDAVPAALAAPETEQLLRTLLDNLAASYRRFEAALAVSGVARTAGDAPCNPS